MYATVVAGLSELTSLNLHGCDLITSEGILRLSGLTNLRQLSLELCSKACGIDHLTGQCCFELQAEQAKHECNHERMDLSNSAITSIHLLLLC